MDPKCICAAASALLCSLFSCLFPSVRESAQEAARNASHAAFSSLGSWLSSLCNSRRTMGNLKREMDELVAIRQSTLDAVTLRESTEDVQRTPEVVLWLGRVVELEKDVAKLQSSSCCCCCACSQPCCGCLCSPCELDDLLQEVRRLKEERRSLGELVSPTPPPPVVEVPGSLNISHSKVVEILDYLKNNEVAIVGIYGMAGVGKTEVLKAVNNRLYSWSRDPQYKLDFRAVIYADLKQKDNIPSTVQTRICERLGISAPDDLPRALSRDTERCVLLLLDNVWEALDWDAIRIPRPGSLLKIVFTTPSIDVCDRMEARAVRVGFLSHNESVELFRRKMREVEEDKPWDECNTFIKTLAERVISQCGGLPQAIITISRAVGKNCDGVQLWSRIEKQLKDSPHEIKGMEAVLEPLRCRMNGLEKNPSYGECLLYCSLFSESRNNIDKEQLIDYWIGEGFLDATGSLPIHTSRLRGAKVIEVLQRNSLLEASQWSEDEIRLHNIVRQMALWQTYGDDNKFLTPARMEELPDICIDENWDNAIRISSMSNKEKKLPNEMSQCPRLVTLLLGDHDADLRRDNMCSIYGNFDDLFKFLPRLRVLDLSGTPITNLPTSISSLVDLHYLNISYTGITSLPSELKALVNLTQLNLRNTHSLSRIPYDAISPLSKKLKTLNLYCSGYNWSHQRRFDKVGDDHDNRQERQVSIEDLENFRLHEFGINITTVPSLDGLLKSRVLFRSCTFLSLDEVNGLTKDHVKLVFDMMSSLRQLSISSCVELTELIFPSDKLQGLKLLHLKDLPLSRVASESESDNDLLPCLRHLQISLCHQLCDLTCIKKFPHLAEMSVTSCNGLIELVASTPATSDGASLPALRKISLKGLPSFTSFSSHFSNLEYIEVSECQILNCLPLRPSNLKTLKEIRGEQTWWDHLEWNQEEWNQDQKDGLFRCFKAL